MPINSALSALAGALSGLADWAPTWERSRQASEEQRRRQAEDQATENYRRQQNAIAQQGQDRLLAQGAATETRLGEQAKAAQQQQGFQRAMEIRKLINESPAGMDIGGEAAGQMNKFGTDVGLQQKVNLGQMGAPKPIPGLEGVSSPSVEMPRNPITVSRTQTVAEQKAASDLTAANRKAESEATAQQRRDAARTRVGQPGYKLTLPDMLDLMNAPNGPGDFQTPEQVQKDRVAQIQAQAAASAANATPMAVTDPNKPDQGIYVRPSDAVGKQPFKAPAASTADKEAARQRFVPALEQMNALGQHIISKVGPAQRADALKRGANAVFGNDPAFKTYMDARRAVAIDLAVLVQGSRPSDTEAAAFMGMLPDPYSDTAESTAMKAQLLPVLIGLSNMPDSPEKRQLLPFIQGLMGKGVPGGPPPKALDYLNSLTPPAPAGGRGGGGGR